MKFLVAGLFALAAAVLPFSVYAYAVSGSSTSLTNLNLDPTSGSWTQLSAPFENFWNSLGSVNPNDIPNEIINPTTQIRSMIPADEKGYVGKALNAVSNAVGWLVGLSDRFAAFVISFTH